MVRAMISSSVTVRRSDRKAEAVDINYIDIAGAQSEAFIQNICAFIGERGHGARDDLVIRNGTPLRSESRSRRHKLHRYRRGAERSLHPKYLRLHWRARSWCAR